MTFQPVVTEEHIETYARDGVVLVRQAIDPQWTTLLLDAWQELRRQMRESPEQAYRMPTSHYADPDFAAEMAAIRSEDAAQRKLYTEQSAGFLRCKYMRWWSEPFRRFVLESSAGEVIGRVIGADEVRFFVDAMFMKEAGLATKTYWHPDHTAWPTLSGQVPTMWMPLLPVDSKLSSLEYLAGSHRHEAMPWPNTFNAKKIGLPPGRETFIDYERRRGEPGLRFLAFDMEPGDVVIIHPRTYHGGGANLHPTQPRIALSTRWFGDEVTWDPRPECINVPGMPRSRMQPGGRPDDDEVFPLVWRRIRAGFSGTRETSGRVAP